MWCIEMATTYVYRLNPSFNLKINGQSQVHMTGDRPGVLFATLESAMGSVAGVHGWTKRSQRFQWESEGQDLITRMKVFP